MAKRQNFVVGSTNPVTVTKTQAELNNGWNKYQVLKSGDLDGVFNAVSDYSNDSSNEIANAIQALTGAQPTGASQNELAGALQQMREDIETSSLTFKGYVATSAPSSATYGLVEGNIWINASAMPTTFPVAIAGVWNGTSWATTTDTYTVQDFDFFRNINDGEGYYWFGGQWVVMSTDMSTTYFTLNQTSGKWEIKSSVNLPGSPTTTTPTSSSPDNQIATKKYVDEAIAPLPTTTYFPDLFDVKWADHICNDVQWLRADTFSWQSGAVYQVAYEHLVDDYNEVPDPSWTPKTQDANLGDNTWEGLAWDGTKFVALGFYGYISSSTDGINWTAATKNTNLGENAWAALAWDGIKFVALSATGHVSTSTNGTTWTAATQVANLGDNTWEGLAWDGTKFVALGRYGHVSSSTDGTTWTAATQDVNLGNNNWRGLAWDGTKFVALGYYGYVSTSTDGTTWTAATQDENLRNRDWVDLAWGDNKFVALSSFNYVSTSTDGINWTREEDANLSGAIWYVLAWGDNKFVALGTSSHTSYKPATYQTETISGITIEYYQAEDGHKLVLPDQESNVAAIYNATGVAWYYIIDTMNQRFKLPRVDPDKETLVEQTSSVPVKTSATSNTVSNWAALKIGRATDGGNNAGDGGTLVVYSDANMGVNGQNQGSTDLGASVPVNLIADFSDINSFFGGKKYLYFYVGNFTQTALENTAGVTTETLNRKADLDLANVLANIDFVIESQLPTAENNYAWYRKYRSGWVEQGGLWTNPSASSSNYTQTLLIEMADNKYQTSVTVYTDTPETNFYAPRASNRTTTTFVITSNQSQIMWQVSGMAAN